MSSKRKRIAVFGCSFTSRYRSNLCRCFNIAAEELDLDMHYFNSLGKIGYKNPLYGDSEFDMYEYVDLSQYDGIVFDGEGYNVEGMADKVIRKLRTAKCAVISISSHVDGFYNIDFDETGGIRALIEHFIDHHHFTKIGFMSGYLTHPDAQARLSEFRKVMSERGMPKDGAGIFEGDFWFNKGNEAADYFLSLPDRPEAIVCANDYMAISLSIALKNRDIRIPEDIAISGFDGTIEGKEFLPHITSATRERLDIARKTLRLLVDLADGKQNTEPDLIIRPRPVFDQSCGCVPLDYRKEAENLNRVYDLTRSYGFNIYDAEASMLKLNKVETVRSMETVFSENSVNFGEFNAFFLMMHTDYEKHPSCNSDFTFPSGKFIPAIWIDKKNEYIGCRRNFDSTYLIPESNSDRCHFYYIMSVNFAECVFGYSVIEMSGKDIFNEFYTVWLLNLGITLENLLKSDRIRKLIRKLENLSIKDDLTGMYNRRGFDNKSRESLASLTEKKTICTMVIDMDGLKFINDQFGHYEGDRAIKSAAEIIMKCCDSGETAGRAGGDEFYIFAVDYSETQLARFISRMKEFIREFNENNPKPYKIDLSYGTYMTETDSSGRLEDLLKISDSHMYEQKLSKPGRRK